MFTLTATSQTVFDNTTLGLTRVKKYYVYAATNDSLIFIQNITGTDSADSAHWATLAEGTGVTFESFEGIAEVLGKRSGGSDSTLNAFPLAYNV